MFKTNLGPVDDGSNFAYLRPETAQAIFTNFKNVVDSTRVKIPFGIAQVGKSFRNEITPGNFVFRTREFEQMEMEYFIPPGEDDQWYKYWIEARHMWYIDLGVRPEKLSLREHTPDELAHYSPACTDVEYEFPFGWSELEGIAKRGCFDLTQHSEATGKDLSFFDEAKKERYIPHVIEPAAGCDRAAMTFLVDAYEEESLEKEGDGKDEKRTVLHFHPRIAPMTTAVFPLVKKEGMPEKAKEIQQMMQEAGVRCFYDQKGAIGRRYRRQDEVGTPWCLTVDGDSLTENSVTIRDRDSMVQERCAIGELVEAIKERMQTWRRVR